MDGTTLTNLLQITTIITAVLMTASILLQSRGASLGAGFGSSGELFTTRRGVDKNLFDATIVLAVIFVGSLLAALLVS